MPFWELFAVAIGLSMDAFAVALGKGLQMRRLSYKKALYISFSFGLFQALMPFFGWLLGSRFAAYISSIDHWIAFVLLSIIGGNMIREGLSDKAKEEVIDDVKLDIKEMIMLSVATSIDALAVGISFGLLNVDVAFSCATIGLTTFVISGAGVLLGHKFGVRFKSKAEVFGGVTLILVGLKILIEHLFF